MRNLPTDIRILDNSEMENVNGGVIGTTMAVAAMIISCAYYIGYKRGKASCEN